MSNAQAELEKDDGLLARTQESRLRIATELLSKPLDQIDAKDTSNALKALDGIDKQIMSKRRLQMEDKQGNQHAQAAALIATVLARVGSSRPYRVELDHDESEDYQPPVLPDDIPTPELVPGELSKVPLKSSIQEFMGK